jgi:hypothetical protein
MHSIDEPDNIMLGSFWGFFGGRKSLHMLPRLVSNSVLQNAGIKGMYHHA